MKQAVIFDVDGVLVASGPAHKASWQMLARKHGLVITDAQFAQTFGMTSREIIASLWGNVDAQRAAALDDEKETLYRELISGMVPLMIGVRETLAQLAQAGFTLAVATSGPPANLDLVLDEGRLRSSFGATANGFEVPRGKPAPDVFLLAAQRAGVAPRDCVVVEDAPVGIQAARAATMRVVGFTSTHPAAALSTAGADRIVARLSDVSPRLVSELLSAAST